MPRFLCLLLALPLVGGCHAYDTYAVRTAGGDPSACVRQCATKRSLRTDDRSTEDYLDCLAECPDAGVERGDCDPAIARPVCVEERVRYFARGRTFGLIAGIAAVVIGGYVALRSANNPSAQGR